MEFLKRLEGDRALELTEMATIFQTARPGFCLSNIFQLIQIPMCASFQTIKFFDMQSRSAEYWILLNYGYFEGEGGVGKVAAIFANHTRVLFLKTSVANYGVSFLIEFSGTLR